VNEIVDKNLAYSRPAAAAAALGADAQDSHRFVDKRVLLTGEAAILGTDNGAEIALDSLLLLVRICSNVTVAIPADCADLRSQLEAIVSRIAPNTNVRFSDFASEFATYDAILSVGTSVHADLPWTVVNSNGWLARISSGTRPISADCNQKNAVGAMAAAALGVADVFKRLISLRPTRGELLDGVSFSLWSYSVDSDDAGPDLPENLPVDLMLVGCGAIGNGTAHLLSRLPMSGRATVVDRQDYGLENWGTCVCIGPNDVGREKARVIGELLRDRLEIKWRKMDIAEIGNELGKSIAFPKVVLNGLDEIDPRHAVQLLWPTIAIDGAISSDFSCQVSCHPWGDDIACLICLFRHPVRRAEIIASRATGLSEEVVASPDTVITEEHVNAAPDDKKSWLMERVGRTVCSITPEAVANLLSSQKQRSGFAPSVPFVACFSSCMIVCELVRYATERRTLPAPRYQLNLLWGPQRGTDYPEARRRNCICVERAKNINLIRAARR
jgi:hypothetical protein